MQTSNAPSHPHPDAVLLAQFEAARAATAAHHTDTTLNDLVAAEDRLALELARSPCANDDEFFAKAAYLLEWEVANAAGREPTMKNDFGAVLIALCEHLKQRVAPAQAA